MFAVSSVPFGGWTFTVWLPAQTVAGRIMINPKMPQKKAPLRPTRFTRQFISGMWTSPFANNLCDEKRVSPQGVLRPTAGKALRRGGRTHYCCAEEHILSVTWVTCDAL